MVLNLAVCSADDIDLEIGRIRGNVSRYGLTSSQMPECEFSVNFIRGRSRFFLRVYGTNDGNVIIPEEFFGSDDIQKNLSKGDCFFIEKMISSGDWVYGDRISKKCVTFLSRTALIRIEAKIGMPGE